MHAIDWSDLRYILALAEAKSFASAGRLLGANPTTVSRRLRIVEGMLQATLFQRDEAGDMQLTSAGEIAAARARIVEAEIGALSAALQNADAAVSGLVRVTAAPFIVNRLLIPAAPAITSRHPALQLELIANPKNLSLTRREADIALRLARPTETAGNRVIARRITTLSYGVYASRENERDFEDLRWIIYDDSMMHLPHAEWVAAEAARAGTGAAVVINEAEGLIQAAIAGFGRALLPRIIGDHIDALVLMKTLDKALPSRELWLLTHPDLRHLARTSVVCGWIEQIFARA